MPKIEVKTLDALVETLKNDVAQPKVISIDGVANAGKSRLAASLVARIGGTHLDLDDYLTQNQARFVAAIRVDRFKAALDAAERPVAVSGVCALDVFSRANRIPDLTVYIMRMARWGWADRDEVEGQQLEEIAAVIGVPVTNFPLAVEVRAYHRKFQPQLTANVVFLRLEYEE